MVELVWVIFDDDDDENDDDDILGYMYNTYCIMVLTVLKMMK